MSLLAHCPHCGEELPKTADAFCPGCRNSLNDAPCEAADTTPAERTRQSAAFIVLLLTAIVGGLTLYKFVAWLNAGAKGWPF